MQRKNYLLQRHKFAGALIREDFPRFLLETIDKLTKLQDTEGVFTSWGIAIHVGVSEHLARHTVRGVLNKEGCFCLQDRQKGLLQREDLSDRVAFCMRVLNQRLGPEFWRKNITFYLDGTGFQFKTILLDQARAPKARAWRKKQEWFHPWCTAKGKRKRSVNTNFMVAIAYNSGVVLCEQCNETINGEKSANIVHSGFPEVFEIYIFLFFNQF